MVRLKTISLYIYKDLRLNSNESRDHYHEDGNLVPSSNSKPVTIKHALMV